MSMIIAKIIAKQIKTYLMVRSSEVFRWVSLSSLLVLVVFIFIVLVNTFFYHRFPRAGVLPKAPFIGTIGAAVEEHPCTAIAYSMPVVGAFFRDMVVRSVVLFQGWTTIAFSIRLYYSNLFNDDFLLVCVSGRLYNVRLSSYVGIASRSYHDQNKTC
jgi:hypothetical protein